MTMKPSEYFRRQIYACFWFERNDMVHMIDKVGEDNVMFETDFPHPTCLYPDPAKYIGDAFSKLPEKTRAKVLGGNAAKLYNIPLQ
jgi:predicted TIM-barrel fold metal-dependent hydrolase